MYVKHFYRPRSKSAQPVQPWTRRRGYHDMRHLLGLGGASTLVMALSVPALAPVSLARGLDLTSSAQILLPAPPPVPARGPAAGERGLVFLPSGQGFLASSQYVANGNVATGAQVQVTSNLGRTWRTVWHQRGASLTWIGSAPGEILAAGSSSKERPFLVETSDAGARWRTVGVALDPSLVTGVQTRYVHLALEEFWEQEQFDFLTPQLSFAMPDSMEGQAVHPPSPPVLLRTTDGGEHWSPVRLPGGSPTGGLVFTLDGHGFATGNSPKCLGQIWATGDYGRTWSEVPGTCVDDWLSSLSFPTPKLGFAAGGDWAKYTATGRQRLDLFQTTDGGFHWHRVYQGPGRQSPVIDYNPFGEVDFVTPEKGFALDGGQVATGSGPTGGHLWVTTDGGRRWAEEDVTGVRLVVTGGDQVWLVGGFAMGRGDVLLRSLNAGRSWEEIGNAARVDVFGLSGYGQDLWVSTQGGQFISDNGGHTWHDPPGAWQKASVAVGATSAATLGPAGLVVELQGPDVLWVSDDGGREGKTVTVPALAQTSIAAAAFARPRDGLVAGDLAGCSAEILGTANGGSSWQRRGTVPVLPVSFAYDGRVAAAGGCPGNQIALSYNAGRSWSTLPVGSAQSTSVVSVSVAGESVAVLCDFIPTGRESLLFSQDEGKHWARWSFSTSGATELPGAVVLNGARSAWAYGPPGMLWHSTDAGRTWKSVPLLLPLYA